MPKTTTITMSNSVTGRDGPIMCKALAYAIEAIDRLPSRWQEWSDREDMVALLEAITNMPDLYRVQARGHLERRGVTAMAGKIVLAERDPAPVVSINS